MTRDRDPGKDPQEAAWRFYILCAGAVAVLMVFLSGICGRPF